MDNLQFFLVIAAGWIALMGNQSSYRWISALLFAEFSIMIGFEAFVLGYLEAFELYNIDSGTESLLYLSMMCLQFMFLTGYLLLGSRALAILSVCLIGNFSYTIYTVLYAIDYAIYNNVMIGISLLQLLAGLSGVIHAYWPIHINLRDSGFNWHSWTGNWKSPK